jgi:hypothetical protein
MFLRNNKATVAATRSTLLSLVVLQAAACSVFETKDEVADEARVVITGTSTAATKLITSTRFERWYDDAGDAHTTLLVADTVPLDLSTSFDQIYPVKPDIGFLVRVVHPDTVRAVVSMKVYFDGELSYDQRDVGLTDSSLEFSYIFSNFNTIY